MLLYYFRGRPTKNLDTFNFSLHCMYDFDPKIKMIYFSNYTFGWSAACLAVQDQIKHTPKDRPITYKPYLVLTSQQDDAVDDTDVIHFSSKIGPLRTLIQVPWANHDVLASSDLKKVTECLGYIKKWLNTNIS